MAVHGDIIEVNFTHPTVGDGTLFPKANEESTIDLGGLRTNDDSNQITANGSLIVQKNRTVAFVECVIENDNNQREDLDKVVQLTESPILANFTWTHVSGAIYSGDGVPVGDIQAGLNAGTFTLKVNCSTITKILG